MGLDRIAMLKYGIPDLRDMFCGRPALAAALRLPRRSTCRRWPAGCRRAMALMKFTLSWLKDHLDTTASVEELADKLSAIGLEVEGVDDPGKKLGAFTIARVLEAKKHPERRQAAGVPGRYRQRRGRGRVRRAQRADRHDRRVRAASAATFPAPGSRSRRSPCAASCPTACWCRSASWSCPTTTRASSISAATLGGKIGKRYADVHGPRRSGDRGEADAEPARLHGRARHRPRPGRRWPRHAQAGARRSPASRATTIARSTSSSSFPRRRADACPCFAGRYIRGVKNGASPAWMQQRLKAVGLAADQCRWSTSPTTSASTAAGRCTSTTPTSSKARSARGSARRARRSSASTARPTTVDETMCVIADDRAVLGFGGIMGGEDTGCTHETQQRADRVRLLRSAAHRRHRPQGRRAERRALPLRARRRSGLHRAGPRSRHAHDAGGGRRQAVEGAGSPARRPSQGRSSPFASAASRSSPASHCPRSRSARR